MENIEEFARTLEPSKEERERVDNIANTAIKLVKEAAKEFKEIKEIVFGGSYAKDTWLTNDVDIDIFVKIDENVSNERFEYIGKNLGLIALKDYEPYLRYSQHPYVESIIDGIKVDVVPCYDVKQGEWKSAADRSIYHTQFIKERFDDEKRREVRLLKRFMRTIGVYGAEIAVNGFSGYVCEVLILKYNTFLNLLNHAKSFKEGEVISIGKYDKSVLKLFNTPLIILDPVDPRRNLGAAISSNSVARFILASRLFLSKPSTKFFQQLDTSLNPNLLDNVIVIKFEYEKRSDDIIWGQAKHSLSAIIKQLEINGFKVIRSSCMIDNNTVVFGLLLDNLSISQYYVRDGPKIFNIEHSDKFFKANKDAEMLWIDNARLMSLRKREANVVRFLNMLLRNNIEQIGISRGLIKDIKRGFTIYTKENLNERLINMVINNIIGTDELMLL